jgi:cytoplasmic iron level regulating protein YaaA (DUF328/UPF0246 family)
VTAAVQAAARTDAAKTLGLSGPGLARAEQLCTDGWIGAPELVAWQRYTGVVHEHLDLAGLDARARARAAGRIWVPSGLAGMVALDEALPEYRCKAGLRLVLAGRLQPVATWWQPQVTAALVAAAPRRLVDLLTNEHRRMLDREALVAAGIELVSIDFVRADGRGAAGHGAKAAKGLLARRIIEVGVDAGLDAEQRAGRVVRDGEVTGGTGRWRQVAVTVG